MAKWDRLQDELRERLANNAKRLREANVWSQEEAAELAGMTARTWRRVERGAMEPTVPTFLTLAQVATALRVDPVDLLAPTKPARVKR
jgi:transcriptional regulator with XRE-family HTH domain